MPRLEDNSHMHATAHVAVEEAAEHPQHIQEVFYG